MKNNLIVQCYVSVESYDKGEKKSFYEQDDIDSVENQIGLR